MNKIGLDISSEPQFEQKPSGHILRDDIVIADTIQCVHCNGHYISLKGQKKASCLHCKGRICGAPKCLICIPFERKLEEYEKQIRADLR